MINYIFAFILLINFELLASEFDFKIESGAFWFNKNDVRIPGDTGTKFDMLNLTGNGPNEYIRLYSSYTFDNDDSIRFTIAPLKVSGFGVLLENVYFQNELFDTSIATKGTYKFNTYRLTYRRLFHKSKYTYFGVGAVALVRDAEISLEQGNKNRSKKDLGFVPLLHLYAKHDLNNNTSIVLDVEGAWSPMGRAIDLALKTQYEFDTQWYISAGYRMLEGGADNESVYTFSWLHYAMIQIGYKY